MMKRMKLTAHFDVPIFKTTQVCPKSYTREIIHTWDLNISVSSSQQGDKS